jgi:hypothetical protein
VRRTSSTSATRRATVVVLAVLAVAAGAVHPASVRAVNSPAGGLPDNLVVSENPVDWTPHVLDGRVYAIAQVGDRMLVGGHFSQVRQAGSKEVLTRRNLFAFDADTGAIDRSFNPAPDGMVSAVVAAPGGGAVFVGGRFGRIAGQAKTALAKLDVPSGRPSDGFKAWVSWRVDDLVVKGSRLFIAGGIESVNGVSRSGLAAVDVGSGALEPGVAVRFTSPRNKLLIVNRIAIRADGSRLVALGSFLKADGQDRPQLAVLDLDGGRARLADWHTDGYAARCAPWFDTYMRGVDISADGSFFVVVTTGSRARPLCDAVARFELGGTGHNIKPTWVDYSGGDTFTGVAVTDAAVYVGGHQRWMNNPYHNDTGRTATPGIGSVPRPGISALDPVNGLPLSWNPGREPRGLGVFTFVATPQGLWIGSDTNNVGGEYHPRLAMFPTKGGKQVRKPAPGRLPAVLYHRTGSKLRAQSIDETGPAGGAPLGGGADWSQARAAFPADGRLYIAWADGRIEVRRLDGPGEFGPSWFLDLGGLAQLAKAKFPVSKLTGMAFDADRGRLYYTIDGDRRLYYRYFTPESGVVGGLPFVASGDGDGLDWSDVRGLAIASGYIFSSRNGEQLHRMDFRGGRPVPGTARVVPIGG